MSATSSARSTSNQHNTRLDGYGNPPRTAVESAVTVFTALEAVKVLLDVLEEITLRVSTIDSNVRFYAAYFVLRLAANGSTSCCSHIRVNLRSGREICSPNQNSDEVLL